MWAKQRCCGSHASLQGCLLHLHVLMTAVGGGYSASGMCRKHIEGRTMCFQSLFRMCRRIRLQHL